MHNVAGQPINRQREEVEQQVHTHRAQQGSHHVNVCASPGSAPEVHMSA